uniref:dihydrofolate reductase n=1 Tax=Monodon monoceros TaxID=40151 RepID=A0A8C6C7A1_MONMO
MLKKKKKRNLFSIPEKNGPLKDTVNIVLSRELKEPPQGAHFLARSLDDALKLIEQPELTNQVDMVWIVGRSSVYKEAMSRPGHLRLLVTRIMQEFESDTLFPEIDLEKYKLLPDIQVFLLMSRRRKALSTDLKYMKRTINVKVSSDLFQASSCPPPKLCIFCCRDIC